MSSTYPRRPYIGVDCSGQPKSPPMIAVATRWSRRNRQNKWVARVKKERIDKYSKTYSDWQEKLYAALYFKVIDKILVANYEVHICRDLPEWKSRRKVTEHLKYLFGAIHSGEIEKENLTISFRTKKSSGYVRDADRKCRWARWGKLTIDERATNIDWLMRLLEKR